MKSDLEISCSVRPKPIQEIAAMLGLAPEEIELHGPLKAKIRLEALARRAERPRGRYIAITGMTPTPLGEGKTVQTLGVSLGLHRLGHTVVTCLRQPAMGPIFGVKGGAAGGGHSQVIPMEDFNLRQTGDFHAVADAHNLLAAFVDNSIVKKNPLALDSTRIWWRRVIDVNDRSLRNVVAGLGRHQDGIPRQTGFDNTAASEVMAIVGLAKGYGDMRERLGRIVVGLDVEGRPVTAEELKAAGAMGAILRDALKPNLMQTIEHTACFVHTGPFANIAHGNSSVLADLLALRCAEFVVTESGFGADMGAEKLFNIKCRASGLAPDAVGLVATLRALKMHGAEVHVPTGARLDAEIVRRNPKALRKGLANLEKQIENVRLHGLPVVVIVNRFAEDPEDELDDVVKAARDLGAEDAAISEAHGRGGEGALAVAGAIRSACARKSEFRHLYPLEATIEQKIEILATRIYGADGVDYSPEALREIRRFTKHGFGHLPICMAKTQFSLSHDPLLKGRPRGFRLPIRDIRAAVGAGFLYPLAGEIQTMPGLPTRPGGEQVDITPDGQITGLF